jgi:hypothetical protein
MANAWTVQSSPNSLNLFAGSDEHFPIVRDTAVITQGNGILKPGQVLKADTANAGQLVPIATSTDVPVAILLWADPIALSTDTTASSPVAVIALTGNFIANALIFGGTATLANQKNNLRALSIFATTSVAVPTVQGM